MSAGEEAEIKAILHTFTDEKLKKVAADLDLAQQPDISREQFIDYLVTQKCVGCK